MNVVIIDYGAGNTKSVQFAFERLGIQTSLSADVETVRAADRVIFPGVGEASSAMRNLKKTGIDVVLPQLQQPVLGICLGMQLMCDHTQENDTPGLAIFNEEVVKFSNEVKVPQIGWNTIYNLRSELFKGIKQNEFMYAVHSFYVPLSACSIALSDYGKPYASALKKDNFYGVQFHPEKSGEAGEQILKNFIEL